MKKLLYILSFITIFCFFSCDSKRIFEKNLDLKNNSWSRKDTLFLDESLNANPQVDFLVNVSHTKTFSWRNIWLTLSLTFPNDSTYITKVNVPLAEPNGKWHGKCNGVSCLKQFPVPKLQNISIKNGTYTIKVSHEMREDPLNDIQSIGVRIQQH